MKDRLSALLIAAISGLAAVPGIASEMHGTLQNAQLGTVAQNGAGRVVKISPSTRFINAGHFEVLIIENHRGQRFTWRFDTAFAPTGFPLRKIAPPGFESGNTWIYVDNPARHVPTD